MTGADPKEYVPLDFVFCGKRWNENSGKLQVSIETLVEGKLSGDRGLYEFTRDLDLTTGAIYSGATFYPGGARGLSKKNVKFGGLWKVQSDRIDWKARHELAETAHRDSKLAADAKKMNDIEQIMLPLRRQYDEYRKKRDYSGMEALKSAVCRALDLGLKASEK